MNTIIIKKKLDSDIIELGTQANFLLGKDVEITVRELNVLQPYERKWNHLGSADISGNADYLNVRNFAHDD